VQAVKDLIFDLIHLIPGGRVFTRKYLLSKNFLARSGWKKSVSRGLPVSEEGEPLPWFTYSAIHFLAGRLSQDMRVFEYGSGNSTLWLAARVKEVLSVEHDPDWHRRMKQVFQTSSRITYQHHELQSGDYATAIAKSGREFDLVIIDGRDRVSCARNSLSALSPKGVVIWDNSDRDTYKEGYDLLLERGFKRLDFFGTGPISSHGWCTSVFYRPGNCLGI
jgi:hypothetical protein